MIGSPINLPSDRTMASSPDTDHARQGLKWETIASLQSGDRVFVPASSGKDGDLESYTLAADPLEADNGWVLLTESDEQLDVDGSSIRVPDFLDRNLETRSDLRQGIRRVFREKNSVTAEDVIRLVEDHLDQQESYAHQRVRHLEDAFSPHEPYVPTKKLVMGALRSCIHAHGPIERQDLTSAAKRVVGRARQEARRVREVFEPHSSDTPE